MAGSVNRVFLIGNLVADPEIRHSQAGKPIANLRLATSESWKDRDGQRQEKTEYHRIVIFNEGLCNICEKYLKKGAKIHIDGALQTRKWSDQSGNDRYSTEIVLQGFNSTLTMLDSRSSSEGAGQRDYGANKGGQTSGAGNGDSGSFNQDMDDEIPF